MKTKRKSSFHKIKNKYIAYNALTAIFILRFRNQKTTPVVYRRYLFEALTKLLVFAFPRFQWLEAVTAATAAIVEQRQQQ